MLVFICQILHLRSLGGEGAHPGQHGPRREHFCTVAFGLLFQPQVPKGMDPRCIKSTEIDPHRRSGQRSWVFSHHQAPAHTISVVVVHVNF